MWKAARDRSPSTAKGAERIYLSRGKGARSLANEDEVAAFLQSEGFTVVACEGLSICEQAAMLARARVVVGLHGAALTNIVFCQPGTIFHRIQNVGSCKKLDAVRRRISQRF